MDNKSNRERASHFAVTVFRNEAFRLPYFFDYYRKMGIDHFILIDNESTDGVQEILRSRGDVTVYLARGSYSASHYGIDWQNTILWKHCVDRWVLVVDPDELLVYPYQDSRDIKELTTFLAETERSSMSCLLLDMYGEGKLGDWQCLPSQDPLEICPFFDAVGYRDQEDRRHKRFIQGGPRLRKFFCNNPLEGPALNKTPLVLWKDYYALKSSTHDLWPYRLNTFHSDFPLTVGALLHFKFAAQFREKVAEEIERKEHWNSGAEYCRYFEAMQSDMVFYCAASRKFESWRDLEASGLINRGYWF